MFECTGGRKNGERPGQKLLRPPPCVQRKADPADDAQADDEEVRKFVKTLKKQLKVQTSNENALASWNGQPKPGTKLTVGQLLRQAEHDSNDFCPPVRNSGKAPLALMDRAPPPFEAVEQGGVNAPGASVAASEGQRPAAANPWLQARASSGRSVPAGVVLQESHDSTLGQLLLLTQDLKGQVLKLQAEASEQQNKVALLQNEVSEIKERNAQMEEATTSAGREKCLPSSPSRGRLVHTLRSVFSRSRSPSRSNSPQKKGCDESPQKRARDEERQPFCGHSETGSPERSRSPTRRIEARLAPRILDNVTGFVDAQIQNLEIRMASMEKSIEDWSKTTIPSEVVDGMPPDDLQRLSGFTVVQSRGDWRPLLDTTADPWSQSPSCSTSTTLTKTRSKRLSTSSQGLEPHRDKAPKQASSWKKRLSAARRFIKA